MFHYAHSPAVWKSPLYNPNPGAYPYQPMPMNPNIEVIHGQQYQIEKQLGKGAFGAVFAANRIPDGKSVAIKLTQLTMMDPKSAAGFADAMLNEIAMSKRLQKASNHIIRLYGFDFDEKRGLGFIVMERGSQDFETYLQTRRPSPPERKNLWRQLVNIAVTLHNRRIVHLDLKPGNLVMFPDGRLKLIDLGIAKKKDTRRTGPNGTWFYSAPEVVGLEHFKSALTSTKSDVWSWGAILYRMTYSVAPNYDWQPCFRPPPNMAPSGDPNLVDVLAHSLVPINQRMSPPWLAAHPYTTN